MSKVSIKIHPSTNLNLERIKLTILERKGGTVTKSDLLDTIVELYSKSIKIKDYHHDPKI